MATSTKPNDDLNKRLRSLKIDRGPAPSPAANNRTPKLLLLGIAALLAVVALGYVFLFSGTKTISVAAVRVESGGASAGESVLTASGYVVAHHKIAVGAKVMGRVAWIGVEKGDLVQEGQVLVRLEDSEFRAQVNQAQANIAAAQARLDSLRTGSRPEEKLKMKAALDYANTQLAATEIKAPVTGTVLQRIVERGEMVSPSAFGGSGARTSVVDLTDLQVELDISQTDFARLKPQQRAEIVPEAYPNLRFTGFIEEIAPEANRAKSTVQVKIKVESPNEQLRPEMNARVNFLADKAPATDNQSIARVLVPKTAVVKKDNGSFVFVLKGNKVEQRTIRTGEESGDAYVVLDELSGNESVAVAGVDKLRDGDRVKVQ